MSNFIIYLITILTAKQHINTVLLETESNSNKEQNIKENKMPKLCIHNLKSQLIKNIENIFKKMIDEYEYQFENNTDTSNELFIEVKNINCLEQQSLLNDILNTNIELHSDSETMKDSIIQKKDKLIELFEELFKELNNVVWYAGLSISTYLERYSEVIIKTRREIDNLKRDLIKKEQSQKLEDLINEVEKMKIGNDKESNIQSTTKQCDVRPKIKNQPIIKKRKQSLLNVQNPTTNKLLQTLDASHTLESPIKKPKEKTDSFLLYLIDLCRGIKDKSKQKEIINRIIKENKITYSDLVLLFFCNNFSLKKDQPKDNSFENQVIVKSNINRCNNAITVKQDEWSKIHHTILETNGSEIFGFYFEPTYEKDIVTPYIHIISNLLKINHSTGIAEINSIKIPRFDLYNISNKEFDPSDPETFTYISFQDISQNTNKYMNVVPFGYEQMFIFTILSCKTYSEVCFIKIPSFDNERNLLCCVFQERMNRRIFIPEKQILIDKDKLYDVFFMNVYKKNEQ
ncbi:hypothetical protein NUSPORA_01278 [Nucleospora cyclopteri]